MKECNNTVTISVDDYAALIVHFEKINAVERFLNNNKYATVNEIASILDVKIKTEENPDG